MSAATAGWARRLNWVAHHANQNLGTHSRLEAVLPTAKREMI